MLEGGFAPLGPAHLRVFGAALVWSRVIPAGRMSGSALRLENLSKHYGTLRAVDGVSLVVQPGEIYGLLGPNGAGKTTTLRVVLGLLAASGGRVEVFGIDIASDPVAARRLVGYLPGDVRLEPGPTGAQTLEFLGRFHPQADVRLRARLAERLDLDLSRRVRHYSKGNRQKLAIVAALQHRPRLALLDEPTSGLDPLVQRAFHDLLVELAGEGSAILLSSHVLAEVEQMCKRVAVLRRGKVVFEGTVACLAAGRVRRLEVAFADPVPSPEELDIPGAFEVARSDNRYRMLCEAPAAEVVRRLARFEVLDLVFERPDLEDMFLRFYEG